MLFYFSSISVFRFGKDDMKKLGDVLNLVLAVPPHGENTFMMSVPSSDQHLTHLQDGVLDCIELIAMVRKFRSFYIF